MMYLREKLNIGYIAELKAQILELPYTGDVSMFLLLPDEVGDASSTGLELVGHYNFSFFKLLGLHLLFVRCTVAR
jgi:serpin B